MPLVSVILTAHNEEAFVEEAVRSVLAETFTDFELLAIDDGSKDRTAEVLQSVRDPRLHVMRQANTGISGTRTRGIEAAQGEILAFLDGDDRWLPDRLARDIAVFTAEPRVGLTCWNFAGSTATSSVPSLPVWRPSSNRTSTRRSGRR